MTRSMSLLAILALAWVGHGCDTLGAAGGVIGQAIPRTIDAAYKGLPGQDVVVMVWAERGLRDDYPDLKQNIAAGLQGRLIQVQQKDKPDALEKTAFPISAQAVIEQQYKHPEWDQEPLTVTAARFNATRMIYIGVKNFSLHAGQSQDLYLGQMTVDLKVIEMTVGADGKVTAKQAFVDPDLTVQFPKDTPADGLPIGTEGKTSEGTINAMIDLMVKRFYKHTEDRN